MFLCLNPCYTVFPLMPNTHRRRRLDLTRQWSRVGVGGCELDFTEYFSWLRHCLTLTMTVTMIVLGAVAVVETRRQGVTNGLLLWQCPVVQAVCRIRR